MSKARRVGSFSVCVFAAQLLAAGAVLAQAAKDSGPACAADNEPTAQAKVVGGMPADRVRWPWLAVLRMNDRSAKISLAQCGGAVIAPNWVVTAAHCVQEIEKGKTRAAFPDPEDDIKKLDGALEVVIGVDDLRKAGSKNVFPVERIIVHEDYEAALSVYTKEVAVYNQAKAAGQKNLKEPASPAVRAGRDIALLKIAGSWNGPFVTVSDQEATDPPGDVYLQVAGFGLVEDFELRKYLVGVDQTLYAGCARLMQVTLPVADTPACSKNWPGSMVGPEQICAGFDKTTDRDSCAGDSGGPLVAFDKSNRPYQVGIVSWGMKDCGKATANIRPYGVYTRLSQFTNWIRANTGVELLRQDPANVAFAGSDPQLIQFATRALNDLDADLGPTRGKVRISLQGGTKSGSVTHVKLDEFYKLEVSSEIKGRLIIVDIDAAGKVTQIFPNKYTTSGDRTKISAGGKVVLPSKGWEFDAFQAQRPIGRGKLLVLVVPEDFPDLTLDQEAQEQKRKGFVPVVNKTRYIMNLLQQVTTASRQTQSMNKPLASEWAYEVIDYIIEP